MDRAARFDSVQICVRLWLNLSFISLHGDFTAPNETITKLSQVKAVLSRMSVGIKGRRE
jgi:hypothetical protein